MKQLTLSLLAAGIALASLAATPDHCKKCKKKCSTEMAQKCAQKKACKKA